MIQFLKNEERGEKQMPNELYRTNDNKKNGEILIDDGVMETANEDYDFIRTYAFASKVSRATKQSSALQTRND